MNMYMYMYIDIDIDIDMNQRKWGRFGDLTATFSDVMAKVLFQICVIATFSGYDTLLAVRFWRWSVKSLLRSCAML